MRHASASMAIAIVLAQLVILSFASGAEMTRAQYVEQSEPICKANTLANRHILKGTREDVRSGKLKVAGRKFRRAANALDRTIQQQEEIPRPSADDSRLARWFVHLNGETKLLEKVANQLSRGSTTHLRQYILELRHNANVANNVVLTFGFEYCLIQPARYL